MMHRICKKCGKQFSSRFAGAKYCSNQCRNRSVEIKCEFCGKIFYKSQKDRRRFCSLKCSCSRKRGGKSIKKCDYCLKDFNTNYKQDRIYCSRECAYSVNRGSSHGSKIYQTRSGGCSLTTIWSLNPSVRSSVLSRFNYPHRKDGGLSLTQKVETYGRLNSPYQSNL